MTCEASVNRLTDYTLGYNDFNNFVMQTLWWLPNKILRHIHKKRFSVFLSQFVRICNQSLQKVRMRAKKIFSKNSIWVKKTQNLTLISNPLKSFLNHNKVMSKNVIEICTIFTFTHVCQTCFAYNFFWCIF